MKFLIDNSISPLIAEKLQTAGYDAVHVRQYNLQTAEDEVIFDRASSENRVIISSDTDFGTILSLRRERMPSIILFHHTFPHRPEKQIGILLANLPQITNALNEGSIVVFESNRIRVRSLPIST